MSCDGTAIGWPEAGDSTLFDDIISTEASICASGESGMCTAIWSPSKSALKAVQTSGWILIALPSTSTGSKAYTQPVKSGSAVQEHRMVFDDLFQNVPDNRFLLLDHFFGLLNGRAVAGLLQPVIDKWLEQLQSHLLRQSTLVQLELRTDYDDGAARVIHTFTQQVLAESALLALQRV